MSSFNSKQKVLSDLTPQEQLYNTFISEHFFYPEGNAVISVFLPVDDINETSQKWHVEFFTFGFLSRKKV